MAELRKLHLAEVSEADLNRWLEEMEEGSRRRIDAMSSLRRRKEAIAGDHLARTALAEKSGKGPKEIVIRRTENGKPCAEEGAFSISHSGEWVVCALSEHPVGVDIEKRRREPRRVAQCYFSEGEKRMLQQDASAFWRIWTGKEALCKLTGEGIAALRRCDTSALPERVRLTTEHYEEYVISLAEEI